METFFLEITAAEYISDYKLLVKFNNGESRVCDFAGVIARYPVFAPLNDTSRFKAFTITDTLETRMGQWSY